MSIDDDGNNTWPEVLQFMLECIQSSEMVLKESALHIFRYRLAHTVLSLISLAVGPMG